MLSKYYNVFIRNCNNHSRILCIDISKMMCHILCAVNYWKQIFLKKPTSVNFWWFQLKSNSAVPPGTPIWPVTNIYISPTMFGEHTWIMFSWFDKNSKYSEKNTKSIIPFINDFLIVLVDNAKLTEEFEKLNSIHMYNGQPLVFCHIRFLETFCTGFSCDFRKVEQTITYKPIFFC